MKTGNIKRVSLAHFDNITYREIIQQSEIWKKAIDFWSTRQALHRQVLKKYRNRTWVFSGCGTSYYLAQAGAALFETITGIRTKAVPGSELLVYPELVFNGRDKFVLVPISRSGTTSEILWATQKALKNFSVSVLPVSCNSHSPLAEEGDGVFTFPFEPERSMVMTGSFTTMLMSILCLAIQGMQNAGLFSALQRVPEAARQIMHQYEPLAEQMASDGLLDFVFLAQGTHVGIANEAAMKLKEMALASTICYHAMEFRHGPMSIVTNRTLVTILFTKAATELEWALARDMQKLGAKVFVLQELGASLAGFKPDFRLLISKGFGDLFSPFLFLPTIQLMGYYLARSRKLNPDSPKNLSPVVKLKCSYGY